MRCHQSIKLKLIRFILPILLLFSCFGVTACGSEDLDLPDELAMPQNLRIENGILYWDAVEYADGYVVHTGGMEHETTDCRYGLPSLSPTEVYQIEVMAYSDRGIVHSKSAYYLYIGKLVLPTVGLRFEFNNDKLDPTLKVTKFAVDEDGVCVIPAQYMGYDVVTIMPERNPVNEQIKTLYLPHTMKNSVFSKEGNVSYFKRLTNLENIILEVGQQGRYFSEGNCIIDRTENAVVVAGINSKIPESVTKIDACAFQERNITRLVVPEHITEIAESAFSYCILLEKIDLPQNLANTILHETFFSCVSLREVNIPKNVKKLEGTFWGCTSLEKITIPDGVEELATYESVLFPDAGDIPTFEECTALSEVLLPATLTKIGRSCFASCSSLKSIIIPENVAVIERNAFAVCPLTEVFYKGTETEWNEKIEIDEWGNDSFLSAPRYYYSETVPEEEGNYWHYVDGVATVWQ